MDAVVQGGDTFAGPDFGQNGDLVGVSQCAGFSVHCRSRGDLGHLACDWWISNCRCLCGGGSKPPAIQYFRIQSSPVVVRSRAGLRSHFLLIVSFHAAVPLCPGRQDSNILEVGTALSRSCDVAFISYLATFIIGCMLSSARRLPKSGRAFDCGRWVFWFAPVTSMYLIGVRLWPPGAFWPGGALFWTFATIGVVSYVVAIRSVGKQLNRYRKSQEKQRKAAQKSQSRLQRPASESR